MQKARTVMFGGQLTILTATSQTNWNNHDCSPVATWCVRSSTADALSVPQLPFPPSGSASYTPDGLHSAAAQSQTTCALIQRLG